MSGPAFGGNKDTIEMVKAILSLIIFVGAIGVGVWWSWTFYKLIAGKTVIPVRIVVEETVK